MAKYVQHYFHLAMLDQFEAASCDSQQKFKKFPLVCFCFLKGRRSFEIIENSSRAGCRKLFGLKINIHTRILQAIILAFVLLTNGWKHMQMSCVSKNYLQNIFHETRSTQNTIPSLAKCVGVCL